MLCNPGITRDRQVSTRWDFTLPHVFILKSQRCFQLQNVHSQEQQINKSMDFKELFSDARSREYR